MTYIEQQIEKINNHPAIQAANDAIVLQAVRMGTRGYEGEKITDFLRSSLIGLLDEVERAVGERRIVDLNISDYSKERKILTLQGEGYNLALDDIRTILNTLRE